MPSRSATHHIAGLLTAVLLAGTGVACSDRSVLEPGPTAAPSFLSKPVPGSYDLSFIWNGVELALLAHVENAEGNPAEGGAAVFQYCSYKGLPPNDITQPDEAPSSACADRLGSWKTLARVPVTGSGDAALGFGTITVVNVIGFRYRYLGQGSGIANWTTQPEDWTR